MPSGYGLILFVCEFFFVCVSLLCLCIYVLFALKLLSSTVLNEIRRMGLCPYMGQSVKGVGTI